MILYVILQSLCYSKLIPKFHSLFLTFYFSQSASIMAFPNFDGLKEEGAEDFCDDYELACITSRHDTDEMRLRVFPLVMKGEV